ncbi:penicillin-binding protein activator [Pectobacterium fontis]|uniref:Penicillin-binding protein activator LpoA n=1 Tax=Pectobacterium fontis TaxID=2558042 RepID=A0A7V8IGL7_9GAMM|nr:penicillin-binding protein activator [Pectobacterium fontis]KHN50060.1 penicillin-binding protein [Pectobacterium fontis]
MLPFHFVRTQAGRVIPVLLAALFLAGCPSHAPQSPPSEVQGKADASSDYYLQQMQQSSDNNKADWQLLAIRSLLQEGKAPQASQQFNTLPEKLSPAQKQEQQLLSVELSIAQNNMEAAKAALSQLDMGALSDQQKQRYYQAQIKTAQGRPSIELLRAYIAQEPLLKGDEHQVNIDQTWLTLTQMPPQESNSLLINANENVLQGWVDLLNNYQDNRTSPDQLKSALQDWQTRYPHHPAAKTLPTQLNQVVNYQQSSVNSIALLLPLNGQAQVFANAIQQGFNAAKNGQIATAPVSAPAAPATNTAQDGQVTPSSDGQNAQSPAPYSDQTVASTTPAPEAQATGAELSSSLPVKVYDTSSQPLANILTQAQQDGASLVIGPLLKNEVDQLVNSQSPLNILALNQPEHVENSPNICYFALSPEDEARDAAKFIHQQGKQQPLVLAPRGALGDRIVNAFAQAWNQQSGSSSTLQQRVGNTAELKQAINSGAGLSLSGQPVSMSQTQAQPGTTIGGLTIPSQVQPTASSSVSGNIDAVYIIATPDELALIKPMIDMRTTSRSRPALYASSRSFQAGLGPDFRLEMEGLQFSDIPLLAGANPALMQQVSSQFKNDYSLVRLYAMGMDAWTLASHFGEMRQIPGHQIPGATGMLSAGQDCTINRQLTWQQYRQGQLVPVL